MMVTLSTCLFANDKVELFKNQLIIATTSSSTFISKTVNGNILTLKVTVGHSDLGKVSSVSLEMV